MEYVDNKHKNNQITLKRIISDNQNGVTPNNGGNKMNMNSMLFFTADVPSCECYLCLQLQLIEITMDK